MKHLKILGLLVMAGTALTVSAPNAYAESRSQLSHLKRLDRWGHDSHPLG